MKVCARLSKNMRGKCGERKNKNSLLGFFGKESSKPSVSFTTSVRPYVLVKTTVPILIKLGTVDLH